jgi:type IV secretion system protein VirB10
MPTNVANTRPNRRFCICIAILGKYLRQGTPWSALTPRQKPQALKVSFDSGMVRTRCPVNVDTALATAGGMAGNAGAVPATYLPASVQKPRSPYQIEAGWLIPAMMDSQMNSDLPGTIRAHVSQNVMDSATGRFVLIPSGARLVGHYDSQIAFGQQRVLVVWDLLKFPDGSELALLGMPAVDQVGAAGLTGEVDNHMWTVIKAATFMSVITAGAQLSQPQSRRSNGDNEGPSVNQTLSAQLGTQLGQVSGNMINRYLNIQPTITTSQGTRFNILVKQNVVFERPWSWK